MPGFVHKVGIAGYGINLAPFFFEIVIKSLEIFQLSRADKSEIRRIKEENTPFSLQILIGYLDKFSVKICICCKFAYFFPVQRHLKFLLQILKQF